MTLTVAITGHRPEDLPNPEWVRITLTEVLRKLNPSLLVQGMAAGADLLSAEVSQEIGLPYVCAKPWAGHTPRVEDRAVYQKALDNAVEVVNVDPHQEYLGPWVYHKRNEYMVDRADIVVAIWTGKAKGGTAACVRYAKRQGKRIVQINPATETVDWNEPPPEPVQPPTLF